MKWDDAKERKHWELERRIHAHSTSCIDTLQPMTDEMWAAESDRIKKFRIDFLASRGLLDYDGTPAPGPEAAALREKHRTYGSKAWERDQQAFKPRAFPGAFTSFWRKFAGDGGSAG